jgi:hypothetical protein
MCDTETTPTPKTHSSLSFISSPPLFKPFRMDNLSSMCHDLLVVCGVTEEDRLQVLGPKETAGEVPMDDGSNKRGKGKSGKFVAWLEKKDYLKAKKQQSKLVKIQEREAVRKGDKTLEQVEADMKSRAEKKKEQEMNREVKVARRGEEVTLSQACQSGGPAGEG